MGRHRLPPELRRKRVDWSLAPSIVDEIRYEARRQKRKQSHLIEELWRRR